MANFAYTTLSLLLGSEGIDFAADDMRCLLVGVVTTADTEEDTTFLSGFTTLDEFVGGSYGRQTLAGEAFAVDNANDRSEFNATAPVFSAIDTDTAQAMILFMFITDDTASPPIGYYDDSPFPVVGNGGDLTVNFNAEGAVQVG